MKDRRRIQGGHRRFSPLLALREQVCAELAAQGHPRASKQLAMYRRYRNAIRVDRTGRLVAQ